MSDELIAKAQKQEQARTALLIAVSEAVTELMRDKGDEWDSKPYRQANRICDLIENLLDASKP